MLKRLIFERIETRITVGIVMFVATMILVGWVAINETARMAAFERQHLGRSIERGALLYNANCATCHGNDGRGLAERAPALNNPHFFGYNPFAAINVEIGSLERLEAERSRLVEELGTNPTAERQQEIIERISAIDERFDAEKLQQLRDERAAMLENYQTAIDNGYLPGVFDVPMEQMTSYLNTETNRLSQVGYSGSLESYIITTLIHGRPSSAQVWPGSGGGMVAWSQRAGGPLRDDQIEDLANYILNWNKGDNWTVEDFSAVVQYGKVHGDAALAGPPVETVGTNVEMIVANLASVSGDPVRGEALYSGGERTQASARLGCASCHVGGAQAPATEGTWERVQNERLPALPGYTAEQYLVESIVAPGNYVVEGYNAGVMPGNYGSQLTLQDLADIIAYLQTQ